MHDSILRTKFKVALENLRWDRVRQELVDKVPTLMRVMGSRNTDAAKPALCICAMILLKLRNDKMNLVQALVSVVLKTGQASMQVYIYICM